MNPTPIRVLITDDHAIVRKGLRALLDAQPDIEVVGEAQNGLEAFEQTAALVPDVLLLDLLMPGVDGIEAARQISEKYPEVRILVLTSFAGDEKVLPAIKAGAMGYLVKDSSPEELIQAIRRVQRGELSLHPSVVRAVLQELTHPNDHVQEEETASQNDDILTEREITVLRLVGRGLSNQEIADQLSITEPTVRTYVSKILSKLNLSSRAQAVLYALREGLASLEDSE